jgi:tRNA(fMet)-specific endonuclease VapC
LRFLLDTNVVSEPLRPAPDAAVMSGLAEHADAIAISAVTWHELRCGVSRMPAGRRRRLAERYVLETLAVQVPILSYDHLAADWHALERAHLEAAGRTVPSADSLIAATAAANGLTLVTRNVRDFRPFEGLEVVTWHRA